VGSGGLAGTGLPELRITVVARALALGTLTGFQLLNVTPSSAPISELPLALIPTTAVPLLLALHITSVLALRSAPRTPRPATSPIIADMPPRTAVVENPGSPAR
jgi:hypothetical protein